MTDNRIDIVEETTDVLSEYGRIPISFEMHLVLLGEKIKGGLNGIRVSELPVSGHPFRGI